LDNAISYFFCILPFFKYGRGGGVVQWNHF
jgi:hypothetical protein